MEETIVEEKIVIPEEVKVEETALPTIEQAKEDGLNQEEIDMGVKHGKIAKVEEVKEPVKEPAKEVKKPEEEVKDISERIEAGEEVKDEEILKSEHSKEEKAYFFKMRRYRVRAQESEKKQKELEDRLAKLEAKKEEPKKEDKKSNIETEIEQVQSDDHLTDEEKGTKIEQIKKESKYITKEDLEERDRKAKEENDSVSRQAQEQDARLFALQKTYEEKDENFNYVMDMATKYMQTNKTAAKSFIERSMEADPVPGEDVFAFCYRIAKLHPDYKDEGEPKSTPKKEEKKDISKMIENSKKKSSASVTGGGGREVSESELTPDDATGLIKSGRWGTLKKSTRERLLRNSDK